MNATPKPTARPNLAPRRDQHYWRTLAAANRSEAVAMQNLATENAEWNHTLAHKMVEFANALTPFDGDDPQRATLAHHTAFALITDALSAPDSFTHEPHLTTAQGSYQVGALLDVIAALTWHAAGALLTTTGSIPAALELVQNAALMQENKNSGTN